MYKNPLLVIASALFLSEQPTYLIDPTDQQLVAQGKQVYDAQCAGCHGSNLEGELNWKQPGENGLLKAPPHDENGHTWHHDNAYLIESIAKGGARLPANVGISPMPAYDAILSEEEIGAVLAYIQSSWPADILAQQSSR